MAVSATLRDRRKADTRAAISAAALRLFADRGYDSVTVADVASEAGVGERTLFRYFPHKQDLVGDRAEALAEALARRPHGEPPGAAIAAATAAVTDRESVMALRAARVPRAEQHTWTMVLTEGLQARGVEPDAARLLARVGVACHDEALERWLADPDPDRPGLARRTRANLGRVGRLLNGS